VSDDWADACAAFTEGAAWFVTTVGRVGDRWTRPGLGDWDVRALVGHTSRALLTVEEYAARPATDVVATSAAAYFRAARAFANGPDVADRGRAAGAALGEDPASEVAAIAQRVTALLPTLVPDQLVTTIVGGMRLVDYLPTRTFELAVHTADLAAALDEPRAVPPLAAAQALAVVTALAVEEGTAGDLLLTVTGRPVAEQFSVL
jgi:hypothetical protein